MNNDNQLIHGDCRDVLADMPEKSIDFVLTDPPYLANYRCREGRTFAGESNDTWVLPAFEHIYRVLKDDSYAVSFYGWHRVDVFMTAWRAAGFRPVGHIVWTKRYPSSVGHTKAQHECGYLLAKGEPRLQSAPPPDVLRFSYTGNKLHPTQKPVEAFTPIIEAYSKAGDVVLDPFTGSGSIPLATFKCDRRFIATEKVWRYYRVAQQRLHEAGAISLETH